MGAPVSLHRIGEERALQWHRLMAASFAPLLEYYRDYETSPAAEPLEMTLERMRRGVEHYLILCGEQQDQAVGGLRCYGEAPDGMYRLGCVFLLPEHQNKGWGKAVMRQAEALHPLASSWELDTILQDERNCHFYESLGYRQIGEPEYVNERLSLIQYVKSM